MGNDRRKLFGEWKQRSDFVEVHPNIFGQALDEVSQFEAELDTERSMRHEAQSDYGNQMDKLEQLEADNAALRRQADELQALCIFEGHSSLHLLKLIADDLDGKQEKSIKRARAGWLRRLVKTAANLEGGDDAE